VSLQWSTPYTQIPPDALPPQPVHDRFDKHVSGMRIHEIAVQRWLNKRFIHQAGFPMAVIFSKPMSAFADFRKEWSDTSGPYAYLTQAKDKEGKPLFQPYPGPVPYPLISVNRSGWSFAPQRNFGSQWYRHAGWVDPSKDMTKFKLAVVREQRMPQAWDYHFQIDHYCLRADQQAHFIQELQLGFFPSAAAPNTWIKAVYPDIFGKRLIRVVLDGDITDNTEVEPQEGYRVYRTTINLLIEGWTFEPDFTYVNAFWKQIDQVVAINPAKILAVYEGPADQRPTEENGIFNNAPNMPPVK
jgi:hypothetical protein